MKINCFTPKWIFHFNAVCIAFVFITLLTGCADKKQIGEDFASNRIQGVRFDPSYYYNLKQPLDKFADSAIAVWQAHGINTIFFKAYDPQYGAVYKTGYKYNVETGYSKKDLLKHFIDASHKRGIKLIAWLPVFEHKGVWEKRPEWRMKNADGSDLSPYPDQHFLCVRQPGFIIWWEGFLKDILKHYPEIDGVDFSEPTIVWKNKFACHCDVCRKEIAEDTHAFSPEAIVKRSQGLTDLLLRSSKIVKAAHKIACLTFIATADAQANLMPFSKQKELTGLDLDKLLDSQDKPQWLSAELMWQQWANIYENPATFKPDWTQKAVEQTLAQINNRVHLLAHVEITPLGAVEVSPNELVESIVAARRGGAQSIEFYDTHLADSMQAWSILAKAWQTQSERKVMVYHDSSGEGVAMQVATLFGHFSMETHVLPVDSFNLSQLKLNDVVAYVGTSETAILPADFLNFARHPQNKLFWLHFNLRQLEYPLADSERARKPGDTSRLHLDTTKSLGAFANLGFKQDGVLRSSEFNTVLYNHQQLFKTDSVFNLISLLDSNRAKIHAYAKSQAGILRPYILQSGNFWYVADCPTDYITEGGRDIAFADLLHEFVGEIHPEKHTGLVRIEDVCPLSDPQSIRHLADILASEGAPFSIALVPFYVDPDENVAYSLTDKPDLVNAIHYAISKGASIVMHGTTHQYRGRSTHDYEFWDALHNTPIFEDSKEYVRLRLRKGIEEMHRNGIYPLVFETPHYACSNLDYSVIDQFFNVEYGRRQVIDKTGYDQLVPYFIGRHPSGNSIIPENLGYVPNDNQDATPIIRFAQNNLAVRDGFASFFFHPWIKSSVLKEIVRGLKKQGYVFSDIRNVPLRMTSPGIVQVTGNQNVTFKSSGQFLHTFFLDREGKKQKEWYSEAPVEREYKQNISCPPGWSFVVEGVNNKPKWYSGISIPKFAFAHTLREKIFATPPLALKHGAPAKPVILWPTQDSNFDAQTWAKAFKICGIETDSLPANQFLDVPQENNLVIVPHQSAAQLSTQQTLLLAQAIAQGKNIILEGTSPLAVQLGIRPINSSKKTSDIRDEYLPQVKIRFRSPLVYQPFEADVQYVDQYVTPKGEPLVAGGEYGEGKYLYFATDFANPIQDTSIDGKSATPYRFPFFLDLLERQFDLHPAIRNPNLEVYFDPTGRENIPLEELVNLWHKNGVRLVHVAGWHDFSTYTFEYGYFINLLHKNGISAYAWIDLPYVSERFWEEHPNWREKTAAGKEAGLDAGSGWKLFMNVTNDTARAGAFHAIKRLILMGPWDGVNLTGSIFTGNNPDSTKYITPFNTSFRAQYQRDKGYDPQEIFSPGDAHWYKSSAKYWNEFQNYRDSIAQSITHEAIVFLEKQSPFQKSGSEIILTRRLDSTTTRADSLYRELLEKDSVVVLQAEMSHTSKMNAFLLNQKIETIKNKFPAWKPMLEINMDKQKPASEETPQLCGMELMDMMATAGKWGRLSLRNEDNVYDVDFHNLAFATAVPVQENYTQEGWTINSSNRSWLDLSEVKNPEVMLDGRIWPVYEKGHLLLPEGKHFIEGCSKFTSWKTLLLSPVEVTQFNGIIQDAQSTLQGLKLNYRAIGVASLVLSQNPKEVYLDGLPYLTESPAPNNTQTLLKDGVLELPAGTHEVEILTRTLGHSIMRQASIGLSALIIGISSLMVSAFTLLYLGGLIKRLWHGATR